MKERPYKQPLLILISPLFSVMSPCNYDRNTTATVYIVAKFKLLYIKLTPLPSLAELMGDCKLNMFSKPFFPLSLPKSSEIMTSPCTVFLSEHPIHTLWII